MTSCIFIHMIYLDKRSAITDKPTNLRLKLVLLSKLKHEHLNNKHL